MAIQHKCIAAGGDYFGGDKSFMCVLSIKVPIPKKSGSLFNDPCSVRSELINVSFHKEFKTAVFMHRSPYELLGTFSAVVRISVVYFLLSERPPSATVRSFFSSDCRKTVYID